MQPQINPDTNNSNAFFRRDHIKIFQNRLMPFLDNASIKNLIGCSKITREYFFPERVIRVIKTIGIEIKCDKKNNRAIESILFSCAVLGNIRIITNLSAEKVNFNIYDNSNLNLLQIAAGYGHLDIVKFLCEEHPYLLTEKNLNGWTPLSLAAAKGYEKIVAYLVDKYPAALQISDNAGDTPLHLAILNKHLNVISLLIEKYTTENLIQENANNNIFNYLISEDNYDLCELLYIKCPELLQKQDMHGFTPLHTAVQTGKFKIVTLFSDKNPILLKIKDCRRRNVLHIATLRDNKEMVAYLYDRLPGALQEQDENGDTPFDLAVRHKRLKVLSFFYLNSQIPLDYLSPEIVDLLQSHSAELRIQIASTLKEIQVLEWNKSIKFKNTEFIKHILKKFVEVDDSGHFLLIASSFEDKVLFFNQLFRFFSEIRKETEELLIKVLKKIVLMKIDGKLIPRSEIETHHMMLLAGCSGFNEVVRYLFKERRIDPYKIVMIGQNVVQLLINKNSEKFPEREVVELMDILDVKLADANDIFGEKYDPRLCNDNKYRSFRRYIFVKAAKHLNKIFQKKQLHDHWISKQCIFNNTLYCLDFKDVEIAKLFLMKQYLESKKIESKICQENDSSILRISDLSSCQNIMALEQEQFSKDHSSLSELWSILTKFPSLFCSLHWQYIGENLCIDLPGDIVPVQLMIAHIASQKKCKMPFDIRESRLTCTPALIDDFIQSETYFISQDFERWDKLVRIIIKDKIVGGDALDKKIQLLEEKRIEKEKAEREEREKAGKRVVLKAKKQPPSISNKSMPVKKKAAEAPKKPTKQKKNQTAPIPAKSETIYLSMPSRDTREAPVVAVSSIDYGQASEQAYYPKKIGDARTQQTNTPLELLLSENLAKTQEVHECFKRLFELSRPGIDCDPLIVNGAALFNKMRVDLACDTLSVDSPIRNLCSYGLDKHPRDSWSHDYFPDPEASVFPLKTDGAIFETLSQMEKGQFSDVKIFDAAKKEIIALFSDCESYRISWNDVFIGAYPNPVPALTEKIAKYLSALTSLKGLLDKYPVGDMRRSYALDAITFFISRIGELTKHIELGSKPFQSLRNEIIHQLENVDHDRETLHAKCLSLLDRLTTFKIPQVVLEAKWEPSINKSFCYNAKLIAKLLRWRTAELNSPNKKIIVLDPVKLSDLQKVVVTNKDGSITFIPLMLGNQKYACLVLNFENQKAKVVDYISINGATDVISEEIQAFTKPFGTVRKAAMEEKKETTPEDHGPLLVERLHRKAQEITQGKQDKIESTFQMRKRHLHLAFAAGNVQLYLKQFLLRGIQKPQDKQGHCIK